MGQAAHPLWSRLGLTNIWQNSLNDLCTHRYYRFEKLTLLKSIIRFFLRTSQTLTKKYWWMRYTTTRVLFLESATVNSYSNKELFHYYINFKSKKFKYLSKYFIPKIYYKLLTTEIYAVTINNYLLVYWFWYKYKTLPQKTHKKKKLHKIFYYEKIFALWYNKFHRKNYYNNFLLIK